MDTIAELLLEIVAEMKLIEKTEVECCGITAYQGLLLMSLRGRDPQSMQQLADSMRVAISTMTRNIEKLVKGGLVKRYKSEKDARLILVSLTSQGEILAEQVASSWQEYFTKVRIVLGQEKEKAVINGLETLLQGLRSAGTCCE